MVQVIEWGSRPGCKVTMTLALQQIAAALDMAIARIWKFQLWDNRFIACHEAISDACIHQIFSSGKPFECEIRTVLQNISHPLVVNLICPTRPKQVSP